MGNPLNYRDGITLTWQNGRELASFSNSSYDITYTYDASGMRTVKDIEGLGEVYYIYENGLLQKMDYLGHIFTFSYSAGGTPIGFKLTAPSGSSMPYYYGTNSRGDIVAIYNYAGTKVATYSYDAYGKLIDTTILNTGHTFAVNNNPLRYRGYVYDTDTGFYYLQTRYYDPTTCRFINADSQLNTDSFNGYNQFAYCDNNPIIYSDPKGMCKKLWEKGIQGPCPGIFSPLCADNHSDLDDEFNLISPILEKEPVDPNSPPDHPNYKRPDKWNGKKVKNPNGSGRGWPAKDNGVWIPDNKMHGGPGWVIQYPGGDHSHAYKNGDVRNHFQLEHSTTESVIYLIGGGIAALWLIGNDVFGVGAADDALIPGAAACIYVGVDGLSGKMVCTVCGEVRYD